MKSLENNVSINIGHEGQILTTTFENNWYWYYETLFWPEQIMRIREICEKSEEEQKINLKKVPSLENIRIGNLD